MAQSTSRVERPFVAKLRGHVWTVTGSLPTHTPGAVALARNLEDEWRDTSCQPRPMQESVRLLANVALQLTSARSIGGIAVERLARC